MKEKQSHKNPECPFISQGVVCDSCGSSNFSLDAGGVSSQKKVSGWCDDCGHRFGKKITITPNQS